jgi:hypothetical protein
MTRFDKLRVDCSAVIFLADTVLLDLAIDGGHVHVGLTGGILNITIVFPKQFFQQV